MKKIIAFGVVLCFVLTLSLLCFSGCFLFKSISIDEVKANLENAGYEVTVMSGEDYIESEENPYPTLISSELKEYLYAVKGEDEIHLYFFYTTDDASENYDFMNNSKLKSGQINDVVYFATKQAKKDAGI